MYLMILDKEETLTKEFVKLQEEFKEVSKAIELNDIENIVEEVLDVVQVCIGMLETLQETKNIDIRQEVSRHVKKLVQRGWKDKGKLLFQVIK